MTLNVRGKDIIFNKVDYETAMFILKRQFFVNKPDIQEESARNMFYYNSEDADMDLEYDIQEAIDDVNDDYIAFRSKFIELYRHLMVHNKYDAYFYYRTIHAFSHVNADRAIDKLIQIEDDKELALAIKFLEHIAMYGMSNGILNFKTRQPILERMIDYFRYDYANAEWKNIFEKMLFNANLFTIDGGIENEFSIFLNLILYRMFLQYDKNFLYPQFAYKLGAVDMFNYLIPKDKTISIDSDEYKRLLLDYK